MSGNFYCWIKSKYLASNIDVLKLSQRCALILKYREEKVLKFGTMRDIRLRTQTLSPLPRRTF